MKITKKNLQDAVAKNILKQDQAKELFTFLKEIDSANAQFNFTHTLYYLGGLIAIIAMTLFMRTGWDIFGGWGIFTLSIVYVFIAIKLTSLFQRKDYHIPAGITASFTVFLVPLGIFGLLNAIGLWEDTKTYQDYYDMRFRGKWFSMEAGALIAGLLILKKYKYPFLVMPIALTIWYISLDIADLFHSKETDLRSLVSIFFGLLMILVAFITDLKRIQKADYSFWLYIFGTVVFWGGLGFHLFENELSRLFYLFINLIMIVIGNLISRRVFVVFGGLGVCGYLGDLSYRLFKDSLLFTVILTAIGFLIIYLGVLWQRSEEKITVKLRSYLPQNLKEFFDSKIE